MSKFYEIEIQIDKDGKVTPGIYVKDTRDEAAILYYSKMASGMKTENIKSVMNVVLNEHGGAEPDLKGYWEKKETEAEA
jgi:hypothetical protein